MYYKLMSKPINKVIKAMIASDVALLTGFGFFMPIFAIFIAQRITVGDTGEAAEIAGFAMAVYWGVKSIFEIPFGKYLDRKLGEKDDLYFVIVGNILAAISVFGFIFSYLSWHIYLLKAIYAIGMAMNVPGWTAIFTRHIDKGKEAFEWATRSTIIGIGAAAAGALGGIIVNNFGFNFLFTGVTMFVFASALLPFLVYKDLASKKETKKQQAGDLKNINMPKR